MKIQLTELPWRTLVTFLPKSISEGLVVSKHCEISSFQHIPKVSDSRVDSKGVHGRRHCKTFQMKYVFWKRKPMAVAQSPQLGEVHLLWHNQRRPHEEQAGQKVKDEQVQHQQELVFTPLKCCNCLRRPV
ncbi:hypothetical protein TNCV_2406171 [Trichonephila clavipes]|nr:hypothetical protein TNCV_2406171 [Trichonephila clavipes]